MNLLSATWCIFTLMVERCLSEQVCRIPPPVNMLEQFRTDNQILQSGDIIAVGQEITIFCNGLVKGNIKCVNKKSRAGWKGMNQARCFPTCLEPPQRIKSGCYQKLKTSNEICLGERELTEMRIGAILRVTCQNGAVLADKRSNIIVRCLSSGKWNNTSASCIPPRRIRYCKTPADPLHGYFSSEKSLDIPQNLFVKGDKVIVRCDPGYVWSGVDRTLECKKSRAGLAFPIPQGSCVPVACCSVPANVPNGKYLSENIEVLPGQCLHPEAELVLTCETGYEVEGVPFAHCFNNNFSIPGICVKSSQSDNLQPEHCPMPTLPHNGYFTGFRSNDRSLRYLLPGNRLYVSCHMGYQLPKSSAKYIECLESLKYSSETPGCYPASSIPDGRYCYRPNYPEFGNFHGFNNNSSKLDYLEPGTILHVSCLPGFEIPAGTSSAIECMSSLMFNASTPVCIQMLTTELPDTTDHAQATVRYAFKAKMRRCSKPTSPVHGTFTTADGSEADPDNLLPGDRLYIACDHGYQISSSSDSYIECLDSLLYSPTPKCYRVALVAKSYRVSSQLVLFFLTLAFQIFLR